MIEDFLDQTTPKEQNQFKPIVYGFLAIYFHFMFIDY